MTTRQVKCPRCGKPSLFTPENAFRPFCSERCKLIDLGAWADETYKVPVIPAPGSQLENELEEELNRQEGDPARGEDPEQSSGEPKH